MRIAFVAALLVAAVVSITAKQPSSLLTRTDMADSFWQMKTAGAPSNFQLWLIREYGRARFRQCRLAVVVFENRGSSELWCEYTKGLAGDLPPVSAREELIQKETLRLIDLFERAALYQGGHIGVDHTSIDGVFETLKATSQSGTVVLVTSGNATFETDSARKELLSQLQDFEKRLRLGFLESKIDHYRGAAGLADPVRAVCLEISSDRTEPDGCGRWSGW